MSEKLKVDGLYKIFGDSPEKVLKMLHQGLSKAQIFEKTGHTVGVQDASFSVDAGEIFVVMGLSGSGKSTLVRMLNRLIEPTAGDVFVDGENVSRMNAKQLIHLRRQNMSMVFQSFALMPHLTVWQNAAFGLEVAGVPAGKRRERAMEALDQVGLKAYGESYPKELSGGMQQRVGLARALAQDPSIMLMDEAFSALDPLIRSEMQDELLKLQEQSDRTVIFISHDLHEAMRIGDRIAIMEGGRVVQIGSPDEILKNPADEYVSSFFRGVDPTTVFSAGDIARKSQVTIIRHKGEGPRAALEQLREYDRDYGYVLDKKKRLQGVVSTDSLKAIIGKGSDGIDGAFLSEVMPLQGETSLQEVLPVVRQQHCPVPIVDAEGVFLGVISKNRFLETLQRGIAE